MKPPVLPVGDPGCTENWEANQMCATAVRALPTPELRVRGQQLRVEGGVGVADHLYVCVKNAADVFVWTLIV